MPKRNEKQHTHTKSGPRRTREDVQAILDKVAARRAEGASIAEALREMEIPYANYNYWIKRYGASGQSRDGVPGGPASMLSGKTIEMQRVLEEIQQMRASGQSLENAIKEKGLTVSNYYYWVKTIAARMSTSRFLYRGPVALSGSGNGHDTVDLLDSMRKNREQRFQVAQTIQLLDNEFQTLLRKLEAS